MGFCSGNPIEVTSGTPRDVAGLRASLIQALSQGVNRGVTPYTGPLGAQTNPLQLMVANMLAQRMGYGGYSTPGFYAMRGMPYSGGLSINPAGTHVRGGGFDSGRTLAPGEGAGSSGGGARGGYGRDRRSYDPENASETKGRGR
jgi:hypothetical protein